MKERQRAFGSTEMVRDRPSRTRSRTTRKKTRAEKTEANREALFWAAAEVVGRHGYSAASIARITARAKMAQGTFYNYFESRQEIFDQLLPRLGEQMLEHVREMARDGRDFGEKEELSLRAFFDFLRVQPHFLRILSEAETHAPKAFKRHMSNVSQGYIAFLKRSRARNEIKNLGDQEIEAIAYILMASRSYLGLRYLGNLPPSMKKKLPDHVVDAYMQLVADGLAKQ